MRKLLFLLFIPLYLTVCGQSAHKLVGRNIKIKSAVDLYTLTAEENEYDHIHYAAKGKNLDGGQASPGEQVYTIPAMKGGKDLILQFQDTLLAMDSLKPKINYTANKAAIAFLNRPYQNYNSSTFTELHPPFELTVVGVKYPGQTYESISQGSDNGLYLGYGGLDTPSVRGVDAGIFFHNSYTPQNYKVQIQRLCLNADSTADYWLNGTKVGSVSFNGVGAYLLRKSFLSWGVFTNGSDFDMIATYFRSGVYSDSHYSTVIEPALAAKWGVGSFVPEIVLSNLTVTQSPSGTYTASVTQGANYSGKTALTVHYSWYWHSDERNYALQPWFKDGPVIHTADFPANDSTHHNVQIKFLAWVEYTDHTMGRKIETAWMNPSDPNKVTP